ncbi:uncharacterized protein LOC125239613 [Leguminivora glycinivorella]|uniref:uncharacterized protein LOC125239613 n=1 Tax=Leguminivora glycinivorella TaxID=1035111 RepID=UPI00200E6E53|nr:uncharacterized protein LOC125239613 [Leguminivora glycinivorella]
MGPPRALEEPSTTDMGLKFWGTRPDKRPADDIALSSGSESDAGAVAPLTSTAKSGKKAKAGRRQSGPKNRTDPLGQAPIVLVERLPLSSISHLPQQETEVTETSPNSFNTGAESDSARSGGSTHDAGLAQAKRELHRLRREELQRKAEQELASLTRSLAPGKSPKSGGTISGPPDTDGADNSAASLHQRVKNSLKTVELVATGSANLKGTFVRALKVAVASIGEAVEDLKELTSSEETRRLQRQNANLRVEVKDLRSEVEELKAELRAHFKKQAPPSSSLPKEAPQPVTVPPGRSDVDELVGAVAARVGRMLDERLGALERDGRLLPGRKKGDKKKAKGKGKGKKSAPKPSAKATATESPLPPAAEPPRPAAATSTDEGWKVAVGGRKKRRKAAAATRARAPQPVPQRAKPKARRLRPPRSAAVVLTLQPEAIESGVNYAQVLSRAKETVNLEQFGITALRFKRAAAGGRVLEIPGAASGEKADLLAEALTEKLGSDVVRVSRPVKCAELRVTELDDSVSPGEVVASVAKVGGCAEGQIKAGEIRQDASGLGTIWLRCPVVVAKKVVEADRGRLQVGWVRAAVKLLDQRPIRCFKCLETGHVRANCTNDADLSDACYRCGKPGHRAAACSEEPRCAKCAKEGKKADHMLGSKACLTSAPKKAKSRAGATRRAPSQPRKSPDIVMETQEVDPTNVE